MSDPNQRIVITGVGLTAPNGNDLAEYRANLLAGKSGVSKYEIRYIGETLAGICNFDPLKYQKRKDVRRGTRAGSIAIYCANEAVQHSGLSWPDVRKDRTGVFIGITEHGNVETENEIFEISKFNYDTSVWTHHHNPRTVANSPAGEVTLSLGITGPHLCIGAACAAGNAGLIQGLQMLRLGEVDLAIAGGVSESIHTFGIFAGFKSQGALATNSEPTKASRPFDLDRNGIVVAEGGGLVTLERLPDALKRGAKIYGEIVGHAMNSDATDFVLPDPTRQAECMSLALGRAGIGPEAIDILSSHATATEQGDIEESLAIRKVFGDAAPPVMSGKGVTGHLIGAAGAVEAIMALRAAREGIVPPTANHDQTADDVVPLDVVHGSPRSIPCAPVLSNSFGFGGHNATLVLIPND